MNKQLKTVNAVFFLLSSKQSLKHLLIQNSEGELFNLFIYFPGRFIAQQRFNQYSVLLKLPFYEDYLILI